ncbi:hypothetical protein FQA39_LY04440 [Lamprigera yunnana]|nr:hypothetical protein FQA39_LY04440 [Lamprigera yunnana]
MNCKTPLQSTDKENLNNNVIDNLKTQLSLTLQEKDTVVQLWQSALRNIDHLEEELKTYTEKTQDFVTKTKMKQMKQTYETKIQDLEREIVNLNERIQVIVSESSKNIAKKNNDLEQANYDQIQTIDQMNILKGEMEQLQVKIGEIIKARGKTENSLKIKNQTINELREKNVECAQKVTEALQIVEAAFREKDAALLREKKYKDEVIKISKTLTEILDETSDKIKEDVNTIRQECDAKLKEAQEMVNKSKDELNTKNTALQKSMYDMDLNQSVNLLFQLSSEKSLVKLETEKKKIKSEMEQIINKLQMDIQQLQSEKQALILNNESLKKRLKLHNKNMTEATEKIQKLKWTLKSKEEHDYSMQNELQSYLEQQINLNKKWKKGMYDTIHKYESQLKNLRNLNRTLKKKLKRRKFETLSKEQHKIDDKNITKKT